jgi:DNA-binding MarR family transcriptional regulator
VPPAKGRPSIFLKLWVAAQRVNLLILHELDVAGASTPHFAMLSMIGLREPLTPTELAREMGFAPTTTSDYLQRLDELGHIRREPNPDDGRSYLIRLTDKGRRAAEAGIPPLRKVLDQVGRRSPRPLSEIEAALDDLNEALAASSKFIGTS